MNDSARRALSQPIAERQWQSLFQEDLTERVLLSVHLLGKPTAAQLHRLHRDLSSNEQSMRQELKRLSGHSQRMLDVIAPIEITRPSQFMPFVYLDTTKSRRHLEKARGIPFRRPPELPSRDWRFLRHDVTLVDELISFELTARAHGIAFGYESHYDENGGRIYPAVTITDGNLTHALKPQPDKTLIVGDYRLVIEHDCGEETIEIGNIIRDATVGRKHLVYDQLARSGALDRLGWGKVIFLYVVDAKKRKQTASRKRIKSCIETFPTGADPQRSYFIDRQTFMAADDDIRGLQWVRADGKPTILPCF